jgi:hypothetical protein
MEDRKGKKDYRYLHSESEILNEWVMSERLIGSYRYVRNHMTISVCMYLIWWTNWTRQQQT